ncbi:inorganic diphosphatase [Anaeromyxobacter sp. PSR-1]|uniref:inorganic diphosphatase n=1 Tax=unclassified Anaeromyxobacter TaxID=2620896 RepID=UPI0005DE7601|nr:inorganic diphosphatase [Anaeromyxobacter sp. PSR-1]GAO04019.1 inorganic pyrophosphatase [Anaeromyxobacter sp. PSR-1]
MTDLARLPPRDERGALRVVVESPRGATLKLKYDAELGVVTVSRPLPLGLAYPYDWGFVPGTRAPDGDPVDALVYWDAVSFPGVVVPCRPVGVVRLEQDSKSNGRVRNDRILAVPVKHPRGDDLRSPDDLPARVRDEIAQFFLSAIFFEPKNPALLGWGGPEEAERLVDGCTRALGAVARRRS